MLESQFYKLRNYSWNCVIPFKKYWQNIKSTLKSRYSQILNLKECQLGFQNLQNIFKDYNQNVSWIVHFMTHSWNFAFREFFWWLFKVDYKKVFFLRVYYIFRNNHSWFLHWNHYYIVSLLLCWIGQKLSFQDTDF